MENTFGYILTATGNNVYVGLKYNQGENIPDFKVIHYLETNSQVSVEFYKSILQ